MDKDTQWIIGIILSLVVIFISYNNVTGKYKHPIITSLVYDNEKTCQQQIQFFSDNVDFNLMFKNTGDKNTNLKVKISSNKLSFLENEKTWALLAGESNPTIFKFKIIKDIKIQNMNSFDINYEPSYIDDKTYSLGQFCCTYNQTSSSGLYPIYTLLKGCDLIK